jgi:hypothetical protein
MNGSQKVTFTGEQRVFLRALVENWQAEAQTAQHCVGLCIDEYEKAKLANRHKHFQTCANDLTTVLEQGHLPPRVAHGQWLEAMRARA